MLLLAHSGFSTNRTRRPGRAPAIDSITEVAAHDDELVDPGGGERIELPMQNRASSDGHHALRDLGGLRPEALTAAGGNDDPFHVVRPSLRLIVSSARAA